MLSDKELDDMVAEYLLAVARRGMMPGRSHDIATHLRVSYSQYEGARERLAAAGRVTFTASTRAYHTIDGVRFGKGEATDPIELLKNRLRRHYPQVFDPRTQSRPKSVARGVPAQLVVGVRVLTIREAARLADEKDAVVR